MKFVVKSVKKHCIHNNQDNFGLTRHEDLDLDIDNFEKLSTAINMHIKSLNFKSRAELIEKNVTYKNEYAIFGEDGKVAQKPN